MSTSINSRKKYSNSRTFNNIRGCIQTLWGAFEGTARETFSKPAIHRERGQHSKVPKLSDHAPDVFTEQWRWAAISHLGQSGFMFLRSPGRVVAILSKLCRVHQLSNTLFCCHQMTILQPPQNACVSNSDELVKITLFGHDVYIPVIKQQGQIASTNHCFESKSNYIQLVFAYLNKHQIQKNTHIWCLNYVVKHYISLGFTRVWCSKANRIKNIVTGWQSKFWEAFRRTSQSTWCYVVPAVH